MRDAHEFQAFLPQVTCKVNGSLLEQVFSGLFHDWSFCICLNEASEQKHSSLPYRHGMQGSDMLVAFTGWSRCDEAPVKRFALEGSGMFVHQVSPRGPDEQTSCGPQSGYLHD